MPSNTFSYDDIDQLTSDNGTSLSYDKSGNRTMSGYTVGAGNRLLSDGTWNCSYNDEGQITSKASATQTHQPRSRIRSASPESGPQQ